MVRQCPHCERDEFVALIDNGDAGFRLIALECEHCRSDIIAAYDGMCEEYRPQRRVIKSSPVFNVPLVIACVALAGVAGFWFGSM